MKLAALETSNYAALLEALGKGDVFDAEERAAKERWEGIKKTLEAWDLAKADFDKRTSDWEIARRQQRALAKDKPTRPAILQKKRETLVRELSDAEETWAKYDPEVKGFLRKRKEKQEIDDIGIRPGSEARAIRDIRMCVPLRKEAWPIQVVNSNKPFAPTSPGVGPGEEWLAMTFGGTVQGGNVSFDVMTSDGRRWEVKSVESGNEIRPGAEGRIAIAKARQRINGVMRQIKDFMNIWKRLKLNETSDEQTLNQIDFVESIVDDLYENVVENGEISGDAMLEIRQALITLNKLRLRLAPDYGKKYKANIGHGEEEFDRPTLVAIRRAAKRFNPGENEDLSLEAIAFDQLKDIAFRDPTRFMNEWYDISAADVFKKAHGVFIVDSSGYTMIPKNRLDDALHFTRVSQGFPRFRFSI